MDGTQNELLVTGVSRSGRVRKKSSKLLDFQSPDEVEKKLKTKRILKPSHTSTPISRIRGNLGSTPISRNRSIRDTQVLFKTNQSTNDVEALGEVDVRTDTENDDETEKTQVRNLEVHTDAQFVEPTGDESMLAGDSSDDGLDELVADIVEGVEAESNDLTGFNDNNRESRMRQSLYMTEKANKRKVLKDGKVITGKQERKDKGKSRYTAYSLWAREFRKTSKFSKNHDLDFSSTARRLSELWANVSNKEKSAWRRKAKIHATKTKAKAREKTNIIGNSSSTTALATANTSNSAFFNRATTSRTRKLAAERIQRQTPNSDVTLNDELPKTSTAIPKRKRNNSLKFGSDIANNRTIDSNKSDHTTDNPSNHSDSIRSTSHASSQLVQTKSTLPSIEPIDAAAHLKLLGESLTIIGERLKEHEGQIAVSGSLSVLLDSLLCSLGPLLCLTTRIPGLENKSQLRDNLSLTLDNIAYVMPGL